jgi:pimeloyl-ACP methyl ester carboxylesterase
MIGSGSKEVGSGPGPEFRSCNSQHFLATEAVEKCPLRYRSCFAKIINASRGEAFGANSVPCSFKEPGSGITALGRMFGWSRHATIHTVRSVRVNSEAFANSALLRKTGCEMNLYDDDLSRFAEHGAALLPAADREELVEHDGALIWYASFGSGPPVILLHGGLGHSGNWGYQVSALVAAGHRVVTIDSRGHGRSTRDDRPYSYELMASDVVAVMDHLFLDKATLVGWSDGACVALVLASKAPARVAGVFFFACNMDPGGTKQIEPSPLLDRCFSRHRKDYAMLSATPGDFDQFVGAVGLMMRTQPNYSREDLGAIKVPVVIVLGEHDEFIKREHANYLADAIPGAELIILPGVSHFAPLQRPDEFNETAVAFIAKVST